MPETITDAALIRQIAPLFTREELRAYADALGVPKGRSKVDAAMNLSMSGFAAIRVELVWPGPQFRSIRSLAQ